MEMVFSARRLPGAARFGGRGGFTLIEISMVLLLFAAAIGGLLSFFPVGLKLESNAISDTAQTMFALDVLGQVEANASGITDWNEWNDCNKIGSKNEFLKKAFENVKVHGRALDVTFRHIGGEGYDTEHWRTDPTNAEGATRRDNWRYVIQCSFVRTPIYFGKGSGSHPANCLVRRISVWVTDHRDGDPTLNTPYVRDMVFMGDVAGNVGN